MIGLFVFFAAVNGFIMVAFAAYGSHGSGAEGLANPAVFETAWQLHAIHTAVMTAIGMCRRPNMWLYSAFWLMLGGTFFFSGSLYGLGFGWWHEGSIITPVGGVMLLAGWFALAISGLYRLSYSNGSRNASE